MASRPSAAASQTASTERTFLRALGPGLISGASDDDPSGIATYAQVGSTYGYGLLWTALFTLPLMTAVQEMCARMALQTGQGLAASLRRKFPTWLVVLMVSLLVIANTINIGADLGAVGAAAALLVKGVPSLVFVVAAALLILGFQLFSGYGLLERVFKWLTLSLLAYVGTMFVVHADAGRLFIGAVRPQVRLDAGWLAALVAVLGTTISPYLFFWQASSEVEHIKSDGVHRPPKRLALSAARADVTAGMAYSQVVMFSIIATSAAVFSAHHSTHFETAAQAAASLQPLAGRFASLLFSLGIIGTGLLAVPVLSGSAANAVGEMLPRRRGSGAPGHRRHIVYGIIVVATATGLIMNLFGLNPIATLFITAVINGIVAPPLLVLINLAAADRRVMGSRANGTLSRTLGWTTALVMAAAAIGLLVTTVAP